MKLVLCTVVDFLTTVVPSSLPHEPWTCHSRGYLFKLRIDLPRHADHSSCGMWRCGDLIGGIMLLPSADSRTTSNIWQLERSRTRPQCVHTLCSAMSKRRSHMESLRLNATLIRSLKKASSPSSPTTIIIIIIIIWLAGPRVVSPLFAVEATLGRLRSIQAFYPIIIHIIIINNQPASPTTHLGMVAWTLTLNAYEFHSGYKKFKFPWYPMTINSACKPCFFFNGRKLEP